MKKVLSIITIVMLLALSVPAYAAGWDKQPEEAEPTGDFILSVTKVEYDQTFTAGGSYYAAWDGTAKIGARIRFVVALSVPENVPSNFNTAELNVALKGITLTEGEKVHKGFNAGGNYSFMYAGYITGEGASATATLAMGRKFENGAFAFGDCVVTHTGDTYAVQSGANVVAFTTDNTSRITAMAVNGTEITYDVAGKVNLSDTDMNALLSILYKLGISLDGNPGYMYEEGFTSRFGGNVKVEANAIYGTPKDDEITVIYPDDILPPQTGDGMSYIGVILICIAVALAARSRARV